MLKPEEFPSKLDLTELVVRSSRGRYLGRAFIFGFPILLCIYYYFQGNQSLVQSYESGEYAVLTFLLALVIAALYHLYRFIKPATFAVLNEKGVWLKKQGLIDWDCIASYYSTTTYYKYGSEEFFFIQLKDAHEVIKIDLSSANASPKTLKRYMYLFKGDRQILNFDEFSD